MAHIDPPIAPILADEGADVVLEGGPYCDCIALWCLRILVRLRAVRNVKDCFGRLDTDLVSFLGLDEEGLEDARPSELSDNLREQLAAFESSPPTMDDPLETNVRILAETLSLTPCEQAVLVFAVLVNNHDVLERTFGMLGRDLDTDSLCRVLAVILGLPRSQVRAAFHRDSALRASGLLRIDGDMMRSLSSKFGLLSGLRDALLAEHANPMTMFDSYFSPSPRTRLGRKDFAHVGEDYGLLVRYLRGALRRRMRGVNVLVYGQPGTGKTELVRSIAVSLGAQLAQVSTSSADEGHFNKRDRFGAYQLTQKVLARRRNALVLFDEIEDVFPNQLQSLFGGAVQSDGRKAWVNALLEDNPVPAFWLSNRVSQIEQAYLRRFDYVLELPSPGADVRRRILGDYLRDLRVRNEWVDGLAAHDRLTPANIQRAAKVVGVVASRARAETVEKQLERVIGNSLQVMGLGRIDAKAGGALTHYRLDVLNPDCDLNDLATGLARSGRGRLCLYGPPGTGKTAYGHYVAERLGKPLLLKRASDLLGQYVGKTEENIAAMFEQARAQKSVLLLDEADSFLRDRTGARQSWEVTQVNELLTQMEAFDGVFVATTNLMDALDAASLRRFDLKIRLDYMRPEQARALLGQVLEENGRKQDALAADVERRFAELAHLTPGNFATVLRRFQIMGTPVHAKTLVDALAHETRVKQNGHGRSIGFAARI